jgi:hypothetical protein
MRDYSSYKRHIRHGHHDSVIPRSHPQFGVDLPEKRADRSVGPLSDGYFGLNDVPVMHRPR